MQKKYKTTTKELQQKIEDFKMNTELKPKSLAEVAREITEVALEARQQFQDYPDWPIRKILNIIGYEAQKGIILL